MTKTDITRQLESDIFYATSKIGVHCCYEVTIGIGGNERVDYMTLDSKGIFRCYEIKVSVSDFRSKAKNSFCGHFNYYVMTPELYEKVKAEIPPHVGVYLGKISVKKAKKQVPLIGTDILMLSLVRSLSRDAKKLYESNNHVVMDRINRRIHRLEKELSESRALHRELGNEIVALYGRKWYEGGNQSDTI